MSEERADYDGQAQAPREEFTFKEAITSWPRLSQILTRGCRYGLTQNEKDVLHNLVERAAGNTYAFPSQNTIAWDCGMSPRSVRRALTALVEKGLIKVTQRGLNRPNLYFPSHRAIMDLPNHLIPNPYATDTDSRIGQPDLSEADTVADQRRPPWPTKDVVLKATSHLPSAGPSEKDMSADSPLPAEAGQEEPHFLVPGNEMAKPSPSVNKDHSAPAMTSRVSPHQTSKSQRTEIDLGVRGGLKNKNGRRNVIDHDLDFMDALRWEYRDWAGLEETLVMAKVDHYYKLSADGQRLHVTRYAANGYKWWKEAQDKTKFTRISGAPIGAPAHQLPFLD